jgi:magnesium transporter
MTETDIRNGALGGQLGTATPRDTTFHGSDPETVAADTICHDTPTHCQARTRLYRDGRLVEQGFAIERISDHLSDSGALVWLDLRNPDQEDLAVLQEEFGLHPVAIEDALVARERPKIDRYRTHLFLTAYSARLDVASGELATSELAAFVLPRALITIRKDDGLDIGKVVERWDASPDLAVNGVGYLVHGLLDYIVDGHFEAVQSLDDAVEGLEDDLFAPPSAKHLHVQRRSFELRKSLVVLRRVVLPMRELLNTMMRRDLRHVNEDLMPYYQDVYDHVLRAAEWTESLRDLVTTILETNLTIQGNRMNVITKKVTSWAAIIAVPTFITGFYGMNVPYPGFSNHVGFLVATVIMIGSGAFLYWVFRRNDWLLSPGDAPRGPASTDSSIEPMVTGIPRRTITGPWAWWPAGRAVSLAGAIGRARAGSGCGHRGRRSRGGVSGEAAEAPAAAAGSAVGSVVAGPVVAGPADAATAAAAAAAAASVASAATAG